MSEPEAWMVIASDGFKALFLTKARADQYAVACHGIVWALYRRGSDNDS